MKNSVQWLRGAREMMGLPAWSTQAEAAYFDAIGEGTDDEALRAMRWCLRNASEFPSPLHLRKVVEGMRTELAQPSTSTKEVGHD